METKHYSDGTVATGKAPLPDKSPADLMPEIILFYHAGVRHEFCDPLDVEKVIERLQARIKELSSTPPQAAPQAEQQQVTPEEDAILRRAAAGTVVAKGRMAEQRQEEADKVLVPLKMTRAMQEVVEQDDWEWAELLEAAECVTEKQYAVAQDEQRQEAVARVAEVHMSRYTLEWTNGPLPEGTPLYAAPQALPLVGDQTGWLIEFTPQGNGVHWLDHKLTFTKDSLKALRFARKEDAEAVIDKLFKKPEAWSVAYFFRLETVLGDRSLWKATEHQWHGGSV